MDQIKIVHDRQAAIYDRWNQKSWCIIWIPKIYYVSYILVYFETLYKASKFTYMIDSIYMYSFRRIPFSIDALYWI